jgi:molecular chaperone HscB
MDHADHFALFGLPRSYEIDLEQLEAAYRRLSLEHHPDFFSAAPPEEQRRAGRNTARLNEGYRVLRSPRLRAEYLLGLLVADMDPAQRPDREQLPPGFLQEMFLLQEEVDELEGGGDAAARAALRTQIAARRDATQQALAALFARAADNGSAEVLQEVQARLNCQRYLERLWERLA